MLFTCSSVDVVCNMLEKLNNQSTSAWMDIVVITGANLIFLLVVTWERLAIAGKISKVSPSPLLTTTRTGLETVVLLVNPFGSVNYIQPRLRGSMKKHNCFSHRNFWQSTRAKFSAHAISSRFHWRSCWYGGFIFQCFVLFFQLSIWFYIFVYVVYIVFILLFTMSFSPFVIIFEGWWQRATKVFCCFCDTESDKSFFYIFYYFCCSVCQLYSNYVNLTTRPS